MFEDIEKFAKLKNVEIIDNRITFGGITLELVDPNRGISTDDVCTFKIIKLKLFGVDMSVSNYIFLNNRMRLHPSNTNICLNLSPNEFKKTCNLDNGNDLETIKFLDCTGLEFSDKKLCLSYYGTYSDEAFSNFFERKQIENVEFFKELDHDESIYFIPEEENNKVRYYNRSCDLSLTIFDGNKIKIELSVDDDHHWGDLTGTCYFDGKSDVKFKNIKYSEDSLEIPNFCIDAVKDLIYLFDEEFEDRINLMDSGYEE